MSSESPPAAEPLAGEVPWQRLHPASVLANLLPVAWRLVRGLAISLLPVLLLARRQPEDLSRLLLSGGLVLGLALVLSVARTLSTRYRFAAGRLEITRGFLFRRARTIDPSRVQNTEVVQTFTHKLLGLVEVKIETASGLQAEGELSALSPERAQALIATLQAARARGVSAPEATAAGEEPEVVLAENGVRELVRYGATATGLGVGAVVLGALLERVELFRVLFGGLARRWEAWAGPGRLWLGVALGVAVAGAVLWLGNGIVAVVRYHGFRLVRAGGRLCATFGLLTRRQVGVSVDRIQLVTLDEPLPRRWLRFGSVEVETAGTHRGQGGVAHTEVTVPVVPAARRGELMRQLVPELPEDLPGLALHPAHPRALRRARLRALGVGTLLALPPTLLLWPWGALAWAVLPLELWRAWVDHRAQGWRLTEHLLIVRRGAWRRRTTVLRRDRIQSLRAVQGPLERRHGLGHVQVFVAGSGTSLPSTGWQEAQALLDVLPLRASPR